jgi:hypothetical protein
MAFNGTPIFEQISPTELRLTGLSLSANTAGIIGFSTASGSPTPDVLLPDTFVAPEASFGGDPIALAALVKVDIEPVTAAGLTNLPPSIEKTGETSVDFRIKITNTKVDLTTQEMEIYFTLLGQASTGPAIAVNVQDSHDVTITINEA